jgi:ATP-dependent protease ClpP protease subunit
MQKFTKEVLNDNSSAKSSYYSNDSQEFSVGFIPSKNGVFKIEINSSIDDVSQFSTAIQALDIAKEDDEIEIHLACCPGGSVDASGTFLHALRKCQAPIHIVASGNVSSAATHILLEADSYELANNFNSLIHNGSGGSGGNLNEWFAMSDFYKKFLYDQYKEIYLGFLSETEIEGVWKGDQIWVDAEGWHTRAVARNEYLRAKFEAQAAAESAKVQAEQEAAWVKIEEEKEPISVKKKPAAKKKSVAKN